MEKTTDEDKITAKDVRSIPVSYVTVLKPRYGRYWYLEIHFVNGRSGFLQEMAPYSPYEVLAKPFASPPSAKYWLNERNVFCPMLRHDRNNPM